MKQLLILLTLLVTISTANGQRKMKEKIEAAKVAVLSTRLELDESTATKFWPIYKAYSNAEMDLRQEKKAYMQTIEDLNVSDAELEKALSGLVNISQKEADLQKKYKSEFARVLTIKQQANLINAERNFKEMLLKKMQKTKGDMQDGAGRFKNRFNK